MRLALAIASFVVLIVHGVVFYDQFFHRWEEHQTAYFEQARSLAQERRRNGRSCEARSPRIEQTIVTSFGDTRVDRCATCHIAVDDPRFPATRSRCKTHPYSAAMGDVQRNGHWERRHKFSDFGCTVCHDGQGRGLETKYSSRRGRVLARAPARLRDPGHLAQGFRSQLKSKDYMEANCAQCHTGREFRRHAPRQARTQALLRQNCYGCHKIEGMSEGTLGPDLTEVGKKFKIDYLWESIVDPRAYLPRPFHAEVQPDRRRRQGAGHLPQEPARRQLRRDLA